MTASLSSLVVQSVRRRDPRALYEFGRQIVRQGRLQEALYGAWCFARHRPSPLLGHLGSDMMHRLLRVGVDIQQDTMVTAGDLARLYPALADLPFHELPQDIRFRRASVVAGDDWMVLGEYGDASGRMFQVSRGGVQVCDVYNHMPRVRHVHSVLHLNDERLIVATGDSAKRLDLWTRSPAGLVLDRCLQVRLAGYTAAVTIGGDHYFGTDFSGRPNYIYRLRDGARWCFPGSGFTKFVVRFLVVDDRYIVSLNASIDTVDASRTLSVFDTVSECFVLHCKVD